MSLSKIEGGRTNSVVNQDINNGVKGKFTPEALEERYRLHARRRLTKAPIIKSICAYFLSEWDITISEQSEKDWALTEKNSIRINAVGEEMIKSGEVELSGISSETLMASLVAGAKDNAGIVKLTKIKSKQLLDAIDTKIEPYKVIGITKEDYFTSTEAQRKEFDSKAGMEIKFQKEKIKMAQEISKIGKDASKNLLDMINKADEINKRHEVVSQFIDDKAKVLSLSRHKTEENVQVGDVFKDQEKIEDMRKLVYGK